MSVSSKGVGCWKHCRHSPAGWPPPSYCRIATFARIAFWRTTGENKDAKRKDPHGPSHSTQAERSIRPFPCWVASTIGMNVLPHSNFCPDRFLANECVQQRLACSVGGESHRGKSQSPVAWVAFVEETKRMKPTDKAARGAVSESPGRNLSEPKGSLDTINPKIEPFRSGRR